MNKLLVLTTFLLICSLSYGYTSDELRSECKNKLIALSGSIESSENIVYFKSYSWDVEKRVTTCIQTIDSFEFSDHLNKGTVLRIGSINEVVIDNKTLEVVISNRGGTTGGSLTPEKGKFLKEMLIKAGY